MSSRIPETAPAPGEPRSAAPTIEARALTKFYGGRAAIRDVSFEAARGEILGFLGPNGAGKTTTMRILTGYTPATSGRAGIAGCDIATQSFEARRRLGYLPERTPLYEEMRVRDYLEFMCELKRSPGPRRRAAVAGAIAECGLEEAAGRIIGTLSRGFRQRVGLAQAILGDPEVLILDEPTVGLDPRQIVEIRRLIRAMAGRRTVLLSTHILPEAAMICDRVVILDEGRVVASGTPDGLNAAGEAAPPVAILHGGDATAAREAAGRVAGIIAIEEAACPEPGRRRLLARAAPRTDPRPDLVSALVAAGIPVFEVTRPGFSLEETFLRALARGGEGETE